jgi:mandelate racemase
MANAIAAGASDLAMVDIMKIGGGNTGWMSAMAQAEAAALPLSNHTFVEPSAHVMAVAPTASWFEYLDIAGAVLSERLLPVDGMVRARARARTGLGRDRSGALRLLVMGDVHHRPYASLRARRSRASARHILHRMRELVKPL